MPTDSLRRHALALGALTLIASFGSACGRKPVASAEAQARAKQIWSERCANCHGETGAGDGPGAAALVANPQSFKDNAWQMQARDEQIKRAIVEGGAAVGKSPAMAANPDLRAEPEVVDELVRMIRAMK